MIILICFLTILSLGRCMDQVPTRLEIETSINRTIDEVERLIESDPSLPRLSRSQIVDILHNITTADMDSYEESVEKARSEYQKALMVVLPYNPKDSESEELKDLYTKAPLVHVIPDPGTMLPFASIQEEPFVTSSSSDESALENLISKKYPEEVRNQFEFPRQEYKNHQSTYANAQLESKPEKYSFNLENVKSSKIKPVTAKPKIEIVYSTGVTEDSTTSANKGVTTERIISKENYRTTTPTIKSTSNILSSDQWTYNAPPTTARPRTTTRRYTSTSTTTERPKSTIKSFTTTPRPTSPKRPSQIRNQPAFFLPTMPSKTEEDYELLSFKKLPETTTKKPQVVTFDMSSMEMIDDKPTGPVYVTPMVTSSSASPLVTLPPSSAPKSPSSMRKEVTNLLATLGLRPSDNNEDLKLQPGAPTQEIVFLDDFTIPDSNNIFPSHATGLDAAGVDSPSIVGQNTFSNIPNYLRNGVNNLTPDVQLLFQRFGLPISGKEEKATTTTTTKPSTVRPTVAKNSWNMFKPLPTSEVKDDSMRDFLSQFGLGLPESRHEKAMKNLKTTTDRMPSVIEAVPSNMKGILENIGLITRSKPSEKIKIQTTTDNPEKLHVFKPHESLIGDENQRDKINELLDTVKMVQEGKADASDIRKAANELLKTTKTLSGGPDPISLEEILRVYNEDLKNEVKRQQSDDMAGSESTLDSVTMTSNSSANSNSNSTSTSKDMESESDSVGTSSDSSPKIVTSGITTTESLTPTEGPNIDDLADSFGGSTAEPDPALPTPRKSGLYFLVDWNSFLEVGEDGKGKDKVNLRFAPKVGDRTRFIPVVVP